ncbi:hypothetical protein TCAL_02305 [Tigriopus californicus]|uniref:GRIP domain-containing protein n=1 Tax=Tigriopus californicus TaxID=6832 RepID=A0A553NQ75_TIGCA|nr:hypothetical protein TCAL_02305 [Tigriopus californicus]
MSEEGGGAGGMTSPPNGPTSGSKKPMAEMDRDELVTKCKSLLQIAQKAKAAKDDAAKKLEKEEEKTVVLEEMVQALTEQKLSQIHRITGENEELLKQMDDFEGQLKAQVATSHDALQQINTLKSEVDHLKRDNAQLKMEHDDFEDLKKEHEEMKEKFLAQAIEVPNPNQDQKYQELNKVIEELKLSQNSSMEEIENLKRELNEESKDNLKLQADLQESSQKLDHYKSETEEKLASSLNEISTLQSKLESIQIKDQELEGQNEELKQAKKEIQELKAEVESNVVKLETVTISLAEKEAEAIKMTNLLIEMDGTKAKAESAEQSLQEFKVKLEESENMIKKMNEKLNLEAMETAQAQREVDASNHEKEMKTLEKKKDAEIEEFKKDVKQSKNRIEELENVLARYERDLQEMKQNQEKSESMHQFDQDRQSEIEECNSKIFNLQKQLDQRIEENKQLQEKLHGKQSTIEDLEAAKQELSDELKFKRALQDDLDAKQDSINELKAEVFKVNEAKTNELQSLAEDLERSKSKVKTLEDSVELRESTIHNLREEMKFFESLQTEKETLSETNEYLKWELNAKSEQTLELQQKTQYQITELRTQVEELSRLVLDKAEQIKVLSEDKEKLEKDLYEVNEKEIEENHELKTLEEKFQNEQKIHQEAIQSLQEECFRTKKDLEAAAEKACAERLKIIQEKDALIESITRDSEEVSKNEQMMSDLTHQIESLQLAQATNNKEIESKDQEIAILRNQLQDANDKVLTLTENLRNSLKSIQEMAIEFEKFKHDASNMLTKGQEEMITFTSNKEMEFVTLKQSLVKELSKAESRNTDLIDEMNQMNMEIKKRGEKLSVVEIQCESMQQEIDAKSKDLYESKKIIQDLNEKITDLNPHKAQSDVEETVASLTKEVEALRVSKASLEGKVKAMNQKIAQEEVQSEAMSTSTVSKVEEHSRMADVENSFEERYSKLKILAIKLKRKSLEQENKIQELTSGAKGGAEKERIASLTQNYAKLQEQNDEQGDLIDEQKSTIFTLRKDVERSTNEITELKDKIETLEATLETTKSQKEALFIDLEQVKSDLTLKQELVKSLEASLKDLTEKHDVLFTANERLNTNLAKFSSDDKRTDLLDMELETAERRIEELTELSQGLEAKIQEMEQDKEREGELKKNRDTLVQDLETSLQKETERADEFKSKLSEARLTISRVEITMSEVRGENLCLQQRVDDLASTNEKINNQLSDLSGNAASNSQALTKRNEALQKMVNILEGEIDRKKTSLAEAEDKIATLTKDYESYKVRAASVLRQSKESESQMGNKSQEVLSLERLVQSLNEKINELSKKIATSEMEGQHIQEDHDRLMERHSGLLQEMAAKELAYRHKHEQLIILANQSEKAKQDLEIKVQNQVEALKQTLRSQIEDLQGIHATEIGKFQKQIDELENQNILLEMALNKAKATSNTPIQASVIRQNSEMPQVHMKTGQKLHVNLLEREAAEGSETEVHRRSSASPRNTFDGRSGPTGPQSPIPLDQLLSQADEEESSYNNGRALSLSNADVGNLESRIASAEKRVKHMASLLSESEAENARLVQMSEVLKEEIRRYQRSEERKKHIENLEYVKNVILKFITLPGNEEKIRLVPVLTTILKLSPKEIETLQKTIQAEIDESSPQEVGWSTYLGLWSQ